MSRRLPAWSWNRRVSARSGASGFWSGSPAWSRGRRWRRRSSRATATPWKSMSVATARGRWVLAIACSPNSTHMPSDQAADQTADRPADTGRPQRLWWLATCATNPTHADTIATLDIRDVTLYVIVATIVAAMGVMIGRKLYIDWEAAADRDDANAQPSVNRADRRHNRWPTGTKPSGVKAQYPLRRSLSAGSMISYVVLPGLC